MVFITQEIYLLCRILIIFFARNPKITDVEEMPLFTEFCNNMLLAQSSIILYRISLNKYIMFTSKTEEILAEVKVGEDTSIIKRNRHLK